MYSAGPPIDRCLLSAQLRYRRHHSDTHAYPCRLVAPRSSPYAPLNRRVGRTRRYTRASQLNRSTWRSTEYQTQKAAAEWPSALPRMQSFRLPLEPLATPVRAVAFPIWKCRSQVIKLYKNGPVWKVS
ncbi:hypothetical protein VTI28DRAFT_10609 [Corynascus sepedonium]